MKPPMNNNPQNTGEDRARLIVALVLSLGVLFGFNHFVVQPRVEAQQAAAKHAAAGTDASVPAPATTAQAIDRAVAIDAGARVPVKGADVSGSIALKGARFDDLTLNHPYKAVDKKENVDLLSPSNTKEGFYYESGWVGAPEGTKLPDADTVWSLSADSAKEVTSGGAAVVLQWDNGAGLLFKKSITLDEHYLFTVEDSIVNTSAAVLKISPYHLVARNSKPVDFAGMFVLHEGPLAFIGGKEYDFKYADLHGKKSLEEKDKSGWAGFTDKYWMVLMLPQPDEVFNTRIVGSAKEEPEHYQTDLVSAPKEVAAGATLVEKQFLYAGVKHIDVIKAYEKQYGFKKLDLSMDFGMWSFFTKPFYNLLHFLYKEFGSIAIAILVMTVIIRGAVFPLANKSFRSMAKMKQIAPLMKELQEKYKDDKAKLQMEIFELYKRENVNPFSGCWPMLIQIPIFFALYKCILLSVELRHAPFWGWIHDLSAPDPTSMFNLFGLIPFTPPAPLMIGAWPVLFCLSMILQKRLSPPMPDAAQERLQAIFPYFITYMMAHFASGLVIYWTWSNILGTMQQYYILKKVGGEDTSLIRGHSGRRKKKA